MNHRKRLHPTLWIGLVTIVLGRTAWAQVEDVPAYVEESPAVQAILETNPATPAEMVRAAKILADLERPDLAKDFLKKVLAAKLGQKQLAQLEAQFGSAHVRRDGFPRSAGAGIQSAGRGRVCRGHGRADRPKTPGRPGSASPGPEPRSPLPGHGRPAPRPGCGRAAAGDRVGRPEAGKRTRQRAGRLDAHRLRRDQPAVGDARRRRSQDSNRGDSCPGRPQSQAGDALSSFPAADIRRRCRAPRGRRSPRF